MDQTEHDPAIAQLLRHFRFAHLPAHLGAASKPFHDVAHMLANRDPWASNEIAALRDRLVAGPAGPEAAAAVVKLRHLQSSIAAGPAITHDHGPALAGRLRLLLEGKDCAVRAEIELLELIPPGLVDLLVLLPPECEHAAGQPEELGLLAELGALGQVSEPDSQGVATAPITVLGRRLADGLRAARVPAYAQDARGQIERLANFLNDRDMVDDPEEGPQRLPVDVAMAAIRELTRALREVAAGSIAELPAPKAFTAAFCRWWHEKTGEHYGPGLHTEAPPEMHAASEVFEAGRRSTLAQLEQLDPAWSDGARLQQALAGIPEGAVELAGHPPDLATLVEAGVLACISEPDSDGIATGPITPRGQRMIEAARATRQAEAARTAAKVERMVAEFWPEPAAEPVSIEEMHRRSAVVLHGDWIKRNTEDVVLVPEGTGPVLVEVRAAGYQWSVTGNVTILAAWTEGEAPLRPEIEGPGWSIRNTGAGAVELRGEWRETPEGWFCEDGGPFTFDGAAVRVVPEPEPAPGGGAGGFTITRIEGGGPITLGPARVVVKPGYPVFVDGPLTLPGPATLAEGPSPDTDILLTLESCTGDELTEEQGEALWSAIDAVAQAHDHKVRQWGPLRVMRHAYGADAAKLALEYATARLAREALGEVLCTDTGCDAKATGWLAGEPWCARHDPRRED